MHLLFIGAAMACMADVGLGLYCDEYPVDARLDLRGLGLVDVLVLDEHGAEVPVTLETKCFDANNNVGGGCRYALAPEGEWTAGAAYTVLASHSGYGRTFEITFDLTITADGRRVEPVTGTPGLAVTRLEYEPSHNSCEPSDPVLYALTVTPSAPGDAEGLSYLQITRTDGYVRALTVPPDAAPFDVEFLASGTADDCFTIVQIDGAGNESESLNVCAEDPLSPDETDTDTCGCNGGNVQLGWGLLIGGVAGLRRRARTSTRARSVG